MEKPIWQGTNVSGQQSAKPHENSQKLTPLVEACDDCSHSQHIDCGLVGDVELKNAPKKLFNTNINQKTSLCCYIKHETKKKTLRQKSITRDKVRCIIIK